MTGESQSKNAMNSAHIAAIASGFLLVTVILTMLLRENGSYLAEASIVIGGLGVAVIGLVVMITYRSM